MKRLLPVVALVGVFTVSGQEPVLKIEQVMTVQEMQQSGVATLSMQQRAALDRWLSEYTLQIIRLAQGSNRNGTIPSASTGPYAGSSSGHWIKSKGDDGSLITLEDGSMWEVNSLDRIDTSLWLVIDNITVLKASSPIGEYKYTLVNTDESEKALVQYLGKQ